MTTRQFYAAGRDTGVLIKRLEAAKEAAARADKAAETLHANAQEFAELANERLMKIRRLEQQIQTQQNTISCLEDDVARLRGDLGEARTELDRSGTEIKALMRRNNEQHKIIQSLRGASGMAVPAVIEAIKALRDEPRRFWDADVFNFADELISRLKGE